MSDPSRLGATRPLHGLPVAVKDVLDTIDLPTGYGSPIRAGHRPHADAACVAWTRAAGGVGIGNTVTTEFCIRDYYGFESLCRTSDAARVIIAGERSRIAYGKVRGG